MLKKNIEKEYKIALTDAEDKINTEAKSIAEDLPLDDRVQKLAHRDSFVKLKDHKPNFPIIQPAA